MIQFGRKVVNHRMQVVRKRTISIAGQRSSIAGVHFSIVVSPTVQPTKSPAPTGGVVRPIARLTIISKECLGKEDVIGNPSAAVRAKNATIDLSFLNHRALSELAPFGRIANQSVGY